jgi:alcohol dehydrogenase class IV
MSQIIEFGNDSLAIFKDFLVKKSPKSILLVTGKNSYKSCGAQSILEKILINYTFTRFFDFEENPKIEDVAVGVKIFNKINSDLIIAVGGGSVIDMAKLINFFNKKKHPFINHFSSSLNKKEIVPFVAIPTTSGTGSEATHFAVVYSNKKKYSLANNLLLPSLVCIVPKFTYKINNYLTAVTAIDALSQAIESFWNVNSNEESLKYAQDSIRIIWEHLPKVLKENNKVDRDMISKASLLSGKAINITKTTAPHAFSYFLTYKLGIPHGHAVAITLPFFCRYNNEITLKTNNDKRGFKFVKKKIESISAILNIRSEMLGTVLQKFLHKIELTIDFRELENFRVFVEEWKQNVNFERLKNNPRKVESSVWPELSEYLLKNSIITHN